METFTPPRPFAHHPDYRKDRELALRELEMEIAKNAIDPPLLPLVQQCIPIPHCFTVQCCYGHFVHRLEPDPENLAPISRYTGQVDSIRYRIAYLALCLEDSAAGHEIYTKLEEMANQNPAFFQFGSADWFWERTPNTYCIQLEPEHMKREDSGPVTWDEAVKIEEMRTLFFAGLMDIMHRHRARCK